MARTLSGLLLLLALAALACAAGAVPAVVDIGALLRTMLVTVALGSGAAALLLWRRRPLITSGEIALAAVSGLVACLALEGYVRVRERLADPYGNATIREDDSLGWTLREGYHGRLQGGVRYTSTADGLRARLNAGAAKRVLILGDSYTHGAAVDDDSTYFARLARRHRDVEFTVMGVGGYGTLQELLWLRRLLPRVRPDLVLVQLAGNDILNNDFALESASLWNNNAMRRPYLEGDSMPYRDPSHTGFADRSALARIIAGHVRVLRSERLGASTIERELPHRLAEEARAVAVSRRLFDSVRVAAQRVPVLCFVADSEYPASLIARAAREAGLSVLPVADSLAAHAGRGAMLAVSPQDRHWNARANSVVADVLDVLFRDRLGSGAVPTLAPK